MYAQSQEYDCPRMRAQMISGNVDCIVCNTVACHMTFTALSRYNMYAMFIMFIVQSAPVNVYITYFKSCIQMIVMYMSHVTYHGSEIYIINKI